MESTSSDRTLLDIGSSTRNHSSIISQLPAAHALTGCDTVAQYIGIGKINAIKYLNSGYSLHNLGDMQAGWDDVVSEATAFISACYGSNKKTPCLMFA